MVAWIGGYLLAMILLGGLYAHIAAFFGSGHWDGLLASFPDTAPTSMMQCDSASGLLMFDEGEFADIEVLLVYGGIRLLRRSRVLRNGKSIYIPWRKIKHIELVKPTLLESQPEGSTQASAGRVMKLVISRGDFPAFELRVPWRDEFAQAVPESVDLRQE